METPLGRISSHGSHKFPLLSVFVQLLPGISKNCILFTQLCDWKYKLYGLERYKDPLNPKNILDLFVACLLGGKVSGCMLFTRRHLKISGICWFSSYFYVLAHQFRKVLFYKVSFAQFQELDFLKVNNWEFCELVDFPCIFYVLVN